MVAADSTESNLFKDIPDGVSIGQVKQAWDRRDIIQNGIGKGREPRQLIPLVHAPLKAIEWVIARLAEGNGKKGTGNPNQAGPVQPSATRSSSEQTNPTRAPAGARQDASPAGPQGSTQQAAQGATVGGGDAGLNQPGVQNQNPAGSTTPGPTRPEGGGLRMEMTEAEKVEQARLLRQISSATPVYTQPTTDSLQSGKPSAMAGQADIPQSYDRILGNWVLYGMQPDKARGILWGFQLKEDAGDMVALRRLITASGYAPQFADECVDMYKRFMFPKGGDAKSAEPAGTGPKGAPTLEDIRRSAGLDPNQGASVEDRIRMAAEVEAMKTEKLKLELKAQRRSLGIQDPDASAEEDEDPVVEIVLSVAGQPFPKKVRQSQVLNYAAWMPRAPGGPGLPGGAPSEEMPAWAKMITDQNKLLQDRLDQQERQRQEDDRRREQAEMVRSAVAPLQDQIRQLSGEGGAGTPASRQLAELRAQLEKQRDDETRKHLDRLEAAVNAGTTPEGLRLSMARYAAGARELNFVPRGEVGRLDEEQIQLESLRKSATRKDEATGKALELVSDRVSGKPFIEIADKFGLSDAAKKLARNLTTTREEREGIGDMPSDEELALQAARLAETSGGPPSPQGGPHQGGTGIEQR